MNKEIAKFFSSIVLLIASFVCYACIPFADRTYFNISLLLFPLQNEEGATIWLGVFGLMLFVVGLFLFTSTIKKYVTRMIAYLLILLFFFPNFFMTAYQEVWAKGVSAISYDKKGICDFLSVKEEILNGTCVFTLQNKSNEQVTLQVEFAEVLVDKGNLHVESLMNQKAPYTITIEANSKKTIEVEELIELTGISSMFYEGRAYDVHIKLIDGDKFRIL